MDEDHTFINSSILNVLSPLDADTPPNYANDLENPFDPNIINYDGGFGQFHQSQNSLSQLNQTIQQNQNLAQFPSSDQHDNSLEQQQQQELHYIQPPQLHQHNQPSQDDDEHQNIKFIQSFQQEQNRQQEEQMQRLMGMDYPSQQEVEQDSGEPYLPIFRLSSLYEQDLTQEVDLDSTIQSYPQEDDIQSQQEEQIQIQQDIQIQQANYQQQPQFHQVICQQQYFQSNKLFEIPQISQYQGLRTSPVPPKHKVKYGEGVWSKKCHDEVDKIQPFDIHQVCNFLTKLNNNVFPKKDTILKNLKPYFHRMSKKEKKDKKIVLVKRREVLMYRFICRNAKCQQYLKRNWKCESLAL